jgi:hypothetical protein
MQRKKMNAKTTTMVGGMSFGLAALLTLLGGCEMVETNRGTVIERTRVLGAHIAVAGDSARATPRPGETAEITWLVTAPERTPPLGWAFIVCAPGPAGEDCAGDPLVVFQGHPQDGTVMPSFQITVPSAAQLGTTRALSIAGMICADSEPQLNPSGPPSCTHGGDGTAAVLSMPLEFDGERNTNPSLAGSPLWIDGQPWTAAGNGSENAACGELPQLTAGTKDHVLRLGTTPTDREPYMTMQGDPPRPVALRESLQISQFSTAGKLERPFSTIDSAVGDDQSIAEVKYETPAATLIPAEGLVVRFTFVARDLRGGTDWTTRSLCVRP